MYQRIIIEITYSDGIVYWSVRYFLWQKVGPAETFDKNTIYSLPLSRQSQLSGLGNFCDKIWHTNNTMQLSRVPLEVFH